MCEYVEENYWNVGRSFLLGYSGLRLTGISQLEVLNRRQVRDKSITEDARATLYQ